MKRLLAIMSVILSLGLAACAGTQQSRATGQVLDDASITARVKTEIAQTRGLGDALQVNVDTYRGVVSLAGFVDNETQKRAVLQAAQRVPGVVDVKNNLEVKSSTGQ